MIDHYYDKLLHIGHMQSGNKYLIDKAKDGMQIMIDFVLSFGKNGYIDMSFIYD